MNFTYETLLAYSKQFPEDSCFPHEPGSELMIETKDGKLFCEPEGETEEKFFDRLERSKKAGRNLFYEEWEPWKPLKDVDY